MYFPSLDTSGSSQSSLRVVGAAVLFGTAKGCATDIGGLGVRGDARGSSGEAEDEKRRRRWPEGEEMLML